MFDSSGDSPTPGGQGRHSAADFRTTQWTVVLRAGQSQCPESEVALGKLCQTYWYPLYAYVRRRGHNPHDAEDLTQEFFARLVDKHWLKDIKREGGKFRSFLLTVLKHFLVNEWARSQAQKRGGGRPLLSLDAAQAESRYQLEPLDHVSPEKLFDRRWAMTILDQVMKRLETDYKLRGRAELFQQLQSCLSGSRSELPYSEIGARLGMNEGAVKVAVVRLRKRYGELLREEIAHTVSSSEEVDDEIRYLISVST